jgi:hypothetical protein
MNEGVIETLGESARWRARQVTYWGGPWAQVKKQIPEFQTRDFRTGDGTPANPYLNIVERVPRTKFEQPVPVGTVSKTYTLAQHAAVGEKCLEGIRKVGISTDNLRCELGLTELGEWMNLRIYFPEEHNHTPKDGKKLELRLECFNSVDASSRLVVLLGWLRLVCSNGLVIGETKAVLKDVHNEHMDLDKIPGIIADGLGYVRSDLERIARWEDQPIDPARFLPWVNKTLTEEWNKKAACRVFHICESGQDVEITDNFARGNATEKPVRVLKPVPGAPPRAKNLYDVSQALSWVATARNNPEEKLDWQSAIPDLIQRLYVGA